MKNSPLLHKNSWFLFLLLLVEGGALMAVELMGAKLVAPFYGNSLYVWTSVLGVTVMSLTLGYYLGGRLSEKVNPDKKLSLIIVISALLVCALPHSAAFSMSLTTGMDLRLGILVTCLLFLLPPLLCFGLVGPLVVRVLSSKLENLGKVAGTVYFTSTIGGIMVTFLYGFYMIPNVGLRMSSYITAFALVFVAIIFFVFNSIAKSNEK